MRLIVLLTLCLFVSPLHAAETPHEKPAAGPMATATVARGGVRAVAGRQRIAMSSSVLVEATAAPLSPTSQRISSETIETAAGAFEDPSRYFQLLPGVVSDSDQRNDFLVRGGNPGENLFVVDNIDVPSINHLALSDTTGGFVSMIDNSAIQSMTLHTAAHDAKFDDRLSSVVEISTIPDLSPGSRPPTRHMTEVGIAGVGGMDSRSLGKNGSMFVSGRQSVLHLFTNDIGMNGVPKYANNLIRGDQTLANGDKIWGLSLTGIDSILIHPDPRDPNETNPFDINYSGWRNTTGINWQHLFSARSFGILTLSNSEQAQSVNLDAQVAADLSIYNEQTHDGDTTLKSEYTLQAGPRVILSGGGNEVLTRIHYDIVQQGGISTNPYGASGDTQSATSIHKNFATDDDGEYGQATALLPAGLRLTTGVRAHRWAFGSHFALTPKTSLTVPLGATRSFTVGLAEYAQMPPFLYLLAFPQNSALAPIRSRHMTAAATLIDHSRLRVTLAAYRKTYRDYPVSTEFPQLTMANIVDTFGQAFLMFPMISRGLGRAAGVEFSADMRPSSWLVLSGNVAYARSWYSGLDGVLRKGNFDLPVVGNIASVVHAGKGFTASIRYSGTSGRPYTPDNLPLSYQQDRDVYDLNQINALRSSPYGRLDFRIEKTASLRSGILLWHVGLDNALDRKNFYAYLWQPHIGGVSQQNQMPRFPDGGVKYTF